MLRTSRGADRRRRPGGSRSSSVATLALDEPREHPGRERGPLDRDRRGVVLALAPWHGAPARARGGRRRRRDRRRDVRRRRRASSGHWWRWPSSPRSRWGRPAIALRSLEAATRPFAEEPPAPQAPPSGAADEPEVRRRQGGEVRAGAGVPRSRHRADRARAGRRSAAARRGRRRARRRRDRHGGRRRVAGARGHRGERARHPARGDPGRHAQSLRARPRSRPRRRRRRPRRLSSTASSARSTSRR